MKITWIEIDKKLFAMTLTITLQPEIEERFREESIRNGVSLEQLTSQRLMENELLWRIRTAAPDSESRLLHRLLKRQKTGTLTSDESLTLQNLLDIREEKTAQRLQELIQLSQLRTIPLTEMMEQLGIHPIPTP